MAGQAANQSARQGAFADYAARKPTNTRRAQRSDLECFSNFLRAAGLVDWHTADTLQTSPAA